MTWHIYAIIIVLIVWFIHYSINLGVKYVDEKKDYFNETGIPMVFENEWEKGKKFGFKYINISNKPISGFEIMIKFTNEGDINESAEYLISLDEDLYIYESRSIKLEATLLNENEQRIIDVFPVKVYFIDGSTWELK